MSGKDNTSPPLSSFELHRQAAIERNLVIAAYIRAAARATAKWPRTLVQRSRRLARDLAAERRHRRAIRELHWLDDRMLKDMGVRRCEIEFVVRNGVPARASRKPHQHQWNIRSPQQRAA